LRDYRESDRGIAFCSREADVLACFSGDALFFRKNVLF